MNLIYKEEIKELLVLNSHDIDRDITIDGFDDQICNEGSQVGFTKTSSSVACTLSNPHGWAVNLDASFLCLGFDISYNDLDSAPQFKDDNARIIE